MGDHTLSFLTHLWSGYNQKKTWNTFFNVSLKVHQCMCGKDIQHRLLITRIIKAYSNKVVFMCNPHLFIFWCFPGVVIFLILDFQLLSLSRSLHCQQSADLNKIYPYSEIRYRIRSSCRRYCQKASSAAIGIMSQPCSIIIFITSLPSTCMTRRRSRISSNLLLQISSLKYAL